MIALHIGLGVLAFTYRPLMVGYLILVVCYFLYRIITKNNKQQEILLAAAYIMAAEVFFRMTKAYFFYETGKYLVILFMIFGLVYDGFKKNAFPYVLYILLLLPGVWIALMNLEYTSNFRNQILFNLSGPLCLAFSAIYCYGKVISQKRFLQILNIIVYPLIAMATYVFLYNPDIREVITGTASSHATSGGYGPNQVTTMFGLGAFILYTRLFIPYKNKIVHIIMIFFMIVLVYRALITFSRGGVIVALIMIIIFTLSFFLMSRLRTKVKIIFKILPIIAGIIVIWLFALIQTGGLIGNRYANKDALGREKSDVTTGRGNLMSTDIEGFKENPSFGLGVGSGKYYRIEELGIEAASHNEITRMLSEHGTFGILALVILLFAPIIDKFTGRQNIYFFPFLLFWFLTINHSSMRIAAPAFIYGLSLLHLKSKHEKSSLHRKSIP